MYLKQCLTVILIGQDVLPHLCFIIGITKDDDDLLIQIYNFLTYCLSQSVTPSFQREFSQLAIGQSSSQEMDVGPMKFLLTHVKKITSDVIKILKSTASEALMSVILGKFHGST